MKKAICKFLILSFAFGICSCGDESSDTNLQEDTASQNPADVQATTSLMQLDPDEFWTHPTEVVSQYGPNGIIRDVVIDRNGIIWMAAWDGIVSYDPESKQFTNHTLKEGLSHNRVYSLIEDNKGNMWFGTMGAGAYKYDGTTFTNLSTNQGMIGNIVFDLFEDEDGSIWFATDRGASRYDGKSFLNITEKDSLRGQVFAISQDKFGVIWLGTSDGLFRYRRSMVEEVLSAYAHAPYSNVRDLYCDKEGNIWIGTSRGLYVSRVYTNSSIEVFNENSKFTSYIHTDNNNNLLLTSDGISCFELGHRTQLSNANPYKVIVKDKSSLGIFGSREASDGTIWYGAMDGLHSVKEGKDVSYKKP